MTRKQQQLLSIHQQWFHNCTCELKNTAIQPVPGVGNTNSPIVFIGEAPGKDEDLKGEPFIGRAGKFLSEMLEMIKMKHEDVYITNTVKYRPPNNRDPLPEEKAACLGWLAEELNCIQPKIIITLGRHALNTFIPEAKISEVHGTLIPTKIHLAAGENSIVKLDTEYVFPLYHPAAAMYNGSLRKVLITDFKKIPGVLKKLKEKKIKNAVC